MIYPYRPIIARVIIYRSAYTASHKHTAPATIKMRAYSYPYMPTLCVGASCR